MREKLVEIGEGALSFLVMRFNLMFLLTVILVGLGVAVNAPLLFIVAYFFFFAEYGLKEFKK